MKNRLPFKFRSLFCLIVSSIVYLALPINSLADTEIAWLDAQEGTLKRTLNSGVVTLQSGLWNANTLALSPQCELHFFKGNNLSKVTFNIGSQNQQYSFVQGLIRGFALSSGSHISTQALIYSSDNQLSYFSTIGNVFSPGAIITSSTPSSKLFWVDSGHRVNQSQSIDAIRRSNIDGSSVEDLVSTVAGRGIAIDESSDWVYWAENKNPVSIKRAHKDGSGSSTLISSGLYYVTHLAYGDEDLYALDADGTIKKITTQSPSVSTLITGIGSGAGIVTLVDDDGDGKTNCDESCPSDASKFVPGVCGCGVPDTDSDGDGTANCIDSCASDINKTTPGACGCGALDTDSDGDGTPNCVDTCPSDMNKVVAGSCGCGVPDTDSDNDGTPNCLDQCSTDPLKSSPGLCGCGASDADTDSDGTPNCTDACINDSNKTIAGVCGCGVTDTDSDGDGTPDCNDQCPQDVSKIAPGSCGCGSADIDSDGDGALNCNETCSNDPLKLIAGVCGCGVQDIDSDGDNVLDCLDQCPSDPSKSSPGKCGCNRFEVVDGKTVSCSEDRPIERKMAPDAARVTVKKSCQVAVSFEELSESGGDVRYNLVLTKQNSTKALLSLSSLPARYLLTVPKAGNYTISYKAVFLKNRKKVFETKQSAPSDVVVSSKTCRTR